MLFAGLFNVLFVCFFVSNFFCLFSLFLFIIANEQIKKEPGSTRIDYQHFLHGYNPQNAPHALEGSATLKAYDKPPLGGSGLLMPPTNQQASSGGFATKDSKFLASTLPNPNNNTSAGSNFGANLRSGAVDDIDLRANTGSLELNAGYTSNYNSKASELKKIWQGVLRECHRSDPERCGQVSRNVFISALEKCNLDRVSKQSNAFRQLFLFF